MAAMKAAKTPPKVAATVAASPVAGVMEGEMTPLVALPTGELPVVMVLAAVETMTAVMVDETATSVVETAPVGADEAGALEAGTGVEEAGALAGAEVATAVVEAGAAVAAQAQTAEAASRTETAVAPQLARTQF